MKKEYKKPVTYFNCDQCGYVLQDCKTEEDVEEKQVVLVYKGTRYHFHSGYAVYGDSNKPCRVWDEAKSCMMRWLTAQRHLEVGEYALTERKADADS